jgi:outer membrane protein OmpA-like peptidoglycan-associated protein
VVHQGPLTGFVKRFIVFSAFAAMFSAGSARAQSRTGFAIGRFEPAERGSRFFVVDTLDLRGPRPAPALGATLDYGYKPLVVRNLDGTERSALVRHQLFAHVGGSYVFAERLRLAINVPLALYQDGEDSVVNGERLKGADKAALGDVRLAADLRLVGATTDPFTFAIGMRAWLPTGARSQLTGDGAARLGPQLLAAGDLGVVTYAARLALVYRARDDVYAGTELGSEIVGAAGVGLDVGRIVVGPEIYASSVLGDAFRTRATPVEWLFGAHVDVTEEIRIGAAIGGGITKGYGTAQPRALLSFDWIPAAAKPPSRHDDEDVDEPFHARPAPPVGDERVAVTDAEIKIAEKVTFRFDSAEIEESSDAILGAVKKALDEHPEIRRVRVEGHTDDVGSPEYNQALSEKRAASVVKWLVDRGVDAQRLESVGYGQTQPIDAAATEEARANNRRVVFRILLRDGNEAP